MTTPAVTAMETPGESGKESCSAAVTRTTCPYCGVGCGVIIKREKDSFTVSGDQQHPANHGLLCSKGYALAETLGWENRLTAPRINNREVSWSEALDRIAVEFQRSIDTYGAESIGFYVSGQLLTEDYYVVNKFVKGYLGTANIDTNSRLCMASSVAGHKRAFGSDTVPGCYEDLELADLIVLVGSNLAWCHPVLLRRIEAAREKNPKQKIVVIDPRLTTTAEIADLHLPISPGGDCDVVLFTGLLRYLVENDEIDYPWVKEHCNGFLEAFTLSVAWKPADVAEKTDLSVESVQEFYQLFRKHEKTVTVYSQGVNQSQCGTDTVNSIINVHLATARIGKPGCGPFSVTGQPNAMGGREVGGLANMLAAHMELDNEIHRDTVQRFWKSPRIASETGLKAVDLFKAVDEGKIKALWIMATNPVDSMPAGNDVARAIAKCPFVVVSEVSSETDTLDLASVQLPAQAWSEKDGTVTNSERRISRQRAFRTGPALSKPDWWAVSEVAKRLGYADAFSYDTAAEIFTEHARLSGFENNDSRDFDISAFSDVDKTQYDEIEPFQWPARDRATSAGSRFFSDGGFYTPDRKARFISSVIFPRLPCGAPGENTDVSDSEGESPGENTGLSVDRKELKVVMNTGRIRDQWHTMTRTGYIPKLSAHLGEPFIQLSTEDAKSMSIDEATLVDVSTELGKVTVRAAITDKVMAGSSFAPMHWSNVFASNARVNQLVQPNTDPVSGQPALKSQIVSVAPADVTCYGLMITREQPRKLKPLPYWAIAPLGNGWKVEFAAGENAYSLLKKMSAGEDWEIPDSVMLDSYDKHQGNFNTCWFSNGYLQKAVYLANKPVLVHREQLKELFDKKYLSFSDRLAALSGVSGAENRAGAIVCSCMTVGINTINNCIQEGADTVSKVGTSCGAGTQCGSCRPEIKKLISSVRPVALEIA